MDLFVAADEWGAKRLNFVTYPAMIKLGTVITYLKKIQKL